MILWVDVETGGLDATSGNVLQVGAIVTDDDLNVLDTFSSYCKPVKPSEVQYGALKVNGLTFDDLKKFDEPAVVHKKFLTFIAKQKSVMHFGAYNSPFDFKFLMFWLLSTGLHTEFYKRVNPVRHIDPLLLARKLRDNGKLKTKNAKLETLANHFNVKQGASHDAVVDITETIDVYKKLLTIDSEGQESMNLDGKKEVCNYKKYLTSRYFIVNDGEIYIKKEGLNDKDAFKFLLEYLHVNNFGNDNEKEFFLMENS